MTVAEAKELVLDLIHRDLAEFNIPISVSSGSPDSSDSGKFIIDGKPARAIHHFDGYYVPIAKSWFQGSFDQPKINSGTFYWYAFAIPGRRGRRDHYFICDYLQMQQWVMEFAAPLGKDYKNQTYWRADISIYRTLTAETQGYFRWGDEPLGQQLFSSRVISLDNVSTLVERPHLVGTFAVGGESEAHRRLKLFVAQNPTVVGLQPTALSKVEYKFRTGDRVDVLFDNSHPLRSVAEIELQGEENICTGIHQAIKYRSLAEADAGYPLQFKGTRALVVAFQTEYQRAEELARKYDVRLITIDRSKVLSPES